MNSFFLDWPKTNGQHLRFRKFLEGFLQEHGINSVVDAGAEAF